MSLAIGDLRPAGNVGLQVIRGKPTDRELTLGEIKQYGRPRAGLPAEVNAWRRANWPNLWRGLRTILPARAFNIPHFYGALWLQKTGPQGVVDYGLASLRLVTTVGVKFICDDFNAGGQDVTTMKFHGFGTGTTAEAVGDSALVTELTTQYAVDNTRPTGSQASATVSTNATYTTVATLSPDSGGTIAITEHGIFSATSAGTLLDRSVFSAVNLVAGSDSLQATYVFTCNSGG
jgi:hypothetical protein